VIDQRTVDERSISERPKRVFRTLCCEGALDPELTDQPALLARPGPNGPAGIGDSLFANEIL
jgi:hypothetical protein